MQIGVRWLLMTFDGVDGLTATTVLNAKLSFCPLVVLVCSSARRFVVSLFPVMLSVVKHLLAVYIYSI